MHYMANTISIYFWCGVIFSGLLVPNSSHCIFECMFVAAFFVCIPLHRHPHCINVVVSCEWWQQFGEWFSQFGMKELDWSAKRPDFNCIQHLWDEMEPLYWMKGSSKVSKSCGKPSKKSECGYNSRLIMTVL